MFILTNLIRLSFTLLLLAFTHLAASAPIHTHELLVFNPHITAPKASAAWARGSEQTVRWETDHIPPQSMHNTGVLLLGYMENDSENLDIDHPLASGFSISSGSVQVTMPDDIPSRDDYFVVLFGDSGNRSQKFKIH